MSTRNLEKIFAPQNIELLYQTPNLYHVVHQLK
jgi:hypothetical protein